MYVNNFTKCLSTGKPRMLANNTNVFFNKKTYEKLFAVANQQLKNIHNWLTSNRLLLNINQNNFIVFHAPHSKISENTNLQSGNANLKRVLSIKFLGVFDHENANWKPHMESHTMLTFKRPSKQLP